MVRNVIGVCMEWVMVRVLVTRDTLDLHASILPLPPAPIMVLLIIMGIVHAILVLLDRIAINVHLPIIIILLVNTV